jgi:hypothetical protein
MPHPKFWQPFLALALLAASPGPALAQTSLAAAAPRIIVVSGEGEASAKPDRAHLEGGVVSLGATAQAALAANAAAMNAVFASLKRLGIPDAKIQTSNFSVSPQYPPYRADAPQPPKIIGYQVSNQVMVTVDDPAKVGPVLDELVKSGANQLGAISFSIADSKPVAEIARRAAVADAATKAKTLAAAAGVTLGPLLSIQEGSVSTPVPMFAVARAGVAAAPTPIAAGEENVRVSVSLTYAIQ